MTTDLTMLRMWREQLYCQCVGDVCRLMRRNLEVLLDFGKYNWRRIKEILRARGLLEIEDDQISALKVRKLDKRV